MSKALKILLIVSLGSSSPISLLVFSKVSKTCVSSILLGYSSNKSLVILPPEISNISRAALLRAYLVILGSIPRSNLKEASVLKP